MMKTKTAVIFACLFLFCGCICCGSMADATAINNQENEHQAEELPDIQVPDEKIYIKFESDTIGANSLESGTVKEGIWSGNIYEIAGKVWNKIWGRQKIQFEVYVRDRESGIESIGMSYNGKSIPQEDLRRQEGLKIFTEGDGEASDTEDIALGYTVFEGTIVCDENTELEVADFAVDWICDRAGNLLKKRIPLNETGKVLYLDDVNPVLDIKIDSHDAEIFPCEEQKVFYSKSPKIKFLLNERNFSKEDTPVYPKVSLLKRKGSDMEFEEDSLWSTKAWKHVSDNLWQLEIKPAVDLQETEYKLVMEAYQDPSGNVLAGAEGIKGISEKGQFESGIFVIDTSAPVLMDYTMNAPTDCEITEIPVYENRMENDVTVQFVIDEHPEYYQPENLIVKVYKAGNPEPIYTINGCDTEKDSSLKLEVDGRKHRYEFCYDGESESVGEYNLTIEYVDRAGNLLTGSGHLTCEKGLFRSDTFLLDHTAPIFDIDYETDAVNVIQNNSLSDSTAYYNSDIKVKFTIEEQYMHRNDETWEHLEFELWEITKEGKRLVCDEQSLVLETKEDNSKYEFFLIIGSDLEKHSTDGNYQFVFRYRDCAGNAMIGMNSETVKEGMYQSPVLVMDTTAPEIVTRYMSDVSKCDNERKFFATHTVFQIHVNDRNIRCGDLTKVLKNTRAKDRYGNPVKANILEDLNSHYKEDEVIQALGNENAEMCVNIALTVDANYEIPVDFVDLAGNRAVIIPKESDQIYREGYVEKVTVDTTIPKLQLTYSYEDPANYMEEGYLFAKKAMNITASATDDTAGIQEIKFTIVDEHGKETIQSKTFKYDGQNTYSVMIPVNASDFKGTVLAEVWDYAGNYNSQKRNHIVESISKHSKTGKLEITTLTAPGRTVKGVDYYNTDVKFRVLMQDTYSGIAKWECTGGNTLREKADYKSEAGIDFVKEPEKEIVHTVDKNFILESDKNDSNDIFVNAKFTDNAGHELSLEKTYPIDVTKPVISVTYDLNEPANGRYYNQTRTATVKIMERNFHPDDVQFLYTSTEGCKPVISGWSRFGVGNDTCYTCTIIFNQDSDYTFTVKCMDLAGNFAEYSRVDEFTIDTTRPAATITYDNKACLNEYYYNKPRTVTIDILEHNFETQAVEALIAADGGGTGAIQELKWSHNGDHHIANLRFDVDAAYTFDIHGTDLASNELEEYEQDYFIIDQTAPELRICDIQNMSANNGLVRPGVYCYDHNYDSSAITILLEGSRNGVLDIKGKGSEQANEFRWKADDFMHVQEMDDLYTMRAMVYDLAGNKSEDRVMFSVNRFGSVYTFDSKTEALVGEHGKRYTNKEIPLTITETNVDTLEFKEITMNLNGRLTTLKEGRDYTVTLLGDKFTWNQYIYAIKEENFEEEGEYVLTIYSKDGAKNVSDNNTKGKKIEFVVDKTSPSVLISGIEDQTRYHANHKEMTIDIEDNTSLRCVNVFIGGKETIYDADQISEMDGKIVQRIEGANRWQKVRVLAEDRAGNITETKEIHFLITPNALVQFYMNKPLFYGSFVLLGIMGGAYKLLSLKKKSASSS